MAKATQSARTGPNDDPRRRTIPAGLLEQLAVPSTHEVRPENVARGRRHERYRTFDNRDVVRQVATELLRVSATL